MQQIFCLFKQNIIKDPFYCLLQFRNRLLPSLLHSAFFKAHYLCKNALVAFSITAPAHLHATWAAHSDPLVFHGKRQKENCNLKTKRKLKEINIFYLSLNFDFLFVSYKYLCESLFGPQLSRLSHLF